MQEERTARSAAARPPETDGEDLPRLDPFPAAAECLTPRRIAQLAWAFLVLGVVVRLIRYLLCFPLWPDESSLASNYLDRGYLDLLHPLNFIQIAPLLYLWVQKTLILAFGFSEYSLRFYSLLCGIGSLFVFRRLAGRLLQGTAYLLAVGVFAVTYVLVRYSAEAKPYSSDMLVTLVLLTFTVEWLRRPREARWWWALILAMPLAVLLSYPAVFVAGGISLTMAFVLWKRRSRRDWLRWIVLNAALCGGLAVSFGCCAVHQMHVSGPHQRANFANAFPPLTSPRELAVFLWVNHTGETIPYPVGEKHGASLLTTISCLTALVLLIRRRRYALAALFTLPLALHFTAAAMHGYPYGNHARFFLYLGSVFCLLVGLGGAAILSRLRSRRWSTAAPATVALALLVVIAAGTSVYDFLKPYKDKCFLRDRDFARWFWPEKSYNAELVCLHNDLHKCFYAAPEGNDPAEGDDLASIYFCNQRIYWRRSWAAEEPAAWRDRITATHPLRCVRFRPIVTTERDEAEFRRWLASVQSSRRIQLVRQDAYPISFWVKQDLIAVDQVEVYEFVPSDVSVAGAPASRGVQR
jgi:hypothetical protein